MQLGFTPAKEKKKKDCAHRETPDYVNKTLPLKNGL